ILKEDIVKIQWHTKVTERRWKPLTKAACECWVEESSKGKDFYLIAHEHLFIFRKPEKGEDTSQYKLSMKWC
ncbi:MAG: hypothetical protein QXJ97_11435, partial [Desulfurococcaceae archaeon]